MKTKLLRRLRREAKKVVRIKKDFGGLRVGPIYSIENDGRTHQDPKYSRRTGDVPFTTYNLSEVIREAWTLREQWVWNKAYHMAVKKAKREQTGYLKI